MSKPLGVLIVGAGKIAGGFDAERAPDAPPLSHAKAYLEHGGFALMAVAEPYTQKREAFCERWNIPEGHDSIDALRERAGDFDVISICSDTSSHADDLAAAIELRPKLIFCEKPVTNSVNSTRQWVEACERADILLAVAHLRRWAPDIVRLRGDLQNGRWGRVRSVQATYNKGVLNNGSHMLDLLRYLFGELSVLAAGQAVEDNLPDDPSIPALLETHDRIPVQLCIANAGDYAHFELQIVAEKGMITMENSGTRWRLRKVIDSPVYRGYRELDHGNDLPGEVHLAFRCAIENIHAALSAGTPLASTGRTALAAQLLCEQLRDIALSSPINTTAPLLPLQL